MEVTLLYFDGCPHWRTAQANLAAALARLGRPDVPTRHVVVANEDDAHRLNFTGSPTILVDGIDPFARPGARPALACRVFSTPQGLAGSPTIEQLMQALT